MQIGIGTMLGMGGGISYLFSDEFIDTVAAGSVNATPATPGVANRVGVDTASKASISGGYYNFDKKASPSYGDPAYWLSPAITRVPGQLVTFHVILTTKGALLLGVDADTAGTTPSQAAFFIQSTVLSIYDLFASPDKIGNVTVGYDYYLTLAARVKGFHYLIRGGPEYPQQTLIWSSAPAAGSAGTFYAEICNNAAVGKSNYVRVPKTLWLPSPVASDAFTRASMAVTDGLGHQETTGLGSGGSGLSWVDKAGTFGITANKAQATALSSGVAITTVDTGKANVNLELTIARSAGISGAILRYVDVDNYIYCGWDGTNWIAVKRVAGVETTVLTAAAALGAGGMKVQMDGTAIYMSRNGVSVAALGGTIADAVLQTSTLHGLYTTNTGNTQDDFVIWSRA